MPMYFGEQKLRRVEHQNNDVERVKTCEPRGEKPFFVDDPPRMQIHKAQHVSREQEKKADRDRKGKRKDAEEIVRVMMIAPVVEAGQKHYRMMEQHQECRKETHGSQWIVLLCIR